MKPQQPELRRSERGATDLDSAKATARSSMPKAKKRGPVPPGNQPGWVPREEAVERPRTE